MAQETKRYLGDGVYVCWEDNRPGTMAVLTTENGIEATNTIFLEPSVLAAFLRWLGPSWVSEAGDGE